MSVGVCVQLLSTDLRQSARKEGTEERTIVTFWSAIPASRNAMFKSKVCKYQVIEQA